MKEERTLKRRHLIYYLEVYNDTTGEQMGHLVDITTQGMKLISKQAIPLDTSFSFRMALPKGYFPDPVIHFNGTSRWAGRDVNPDFHVTGFEVQNLDPEARKVVVKLITWLGFND